MTMIRQTEERAAPAVAAPVSPSLRNGNLPSAKKRSRSKLIMNRLQAKGSKKSGSSGGIEIQPVRERGGGGGRRLSFGGGGTAASAAYSAKHSYVDRVVHELVETERTYVRNLRFIVEDYLSVIIDRRGLPLTRDQVYTLFGNIEDIYAFNSDLLQGLEDCAGDFVAIANCFVLKSEDFHIYTQYCTNYPSSMAILSDCMQNKTLLAFFRERQAALRHWLPLGSYLLKPVQRILKYHLFLKDIASRLDNGATGREVVSQALAAMHGVAQYINEMKRKHEHAIRAQEIQGLLVCGKERLDVGELGELVQEGTFHIKHGRKERTLFLFATALLVTKRREDGTFSHKSRINCCDLMMSESTMERTFSVWKQTDPKTRVTFQTKSPNEQKLWTFQLKKLILKSYPEAVPDQVMQVILDMNPLADQNAPESKPESSACWLGGDAASDSPSLPPSATPPPLQPPDPARRPSRKPSRESPRESPRPHIVRRPSGDSGDPGGSGGPAGRGVTPPSLRRDAGGRGAAALPLGDRARSCVEGSSEDTTTTAVAAVMTSAVTPRADEVVSPRSRGSVDVEQDRGFATAQCPSEPAVPSAATETSFVRDDAGSPLPASRRHLSPRCRLSLDLAYNNKGSDSDQVAITESSGEDLDYEDDEDDDFDDDDNGDGEEIGGRAETGADDRSPRADISARGLGEACDGPGAHDAGGGDSGRRGRDSTPAPPTPPDEPGKEASATPSLATPTSTNPSSTSSRRGSTEEEEEAEAERRRASPRSPARILAGAAGRPPRGPRADSGPSGLPDAAPLNGFPPRGLPPPDRPGESSAPRANSDGCDDAAAAEEEVGRFLKSFGDDDEEDNGGGSDAFGEEFDADQPRAAGPRPVAPHLNHNGGGNGAAAAAAEPGSRRSSSDDPFDGDSLAVTAPSRGEALQLSRASSLSKKDRQLIEKIKNYYDREAGEDARGHAPVKRRESLAHIPQGKVRNSIFVRTQQLQRIRSEEDCGGAAEPAPAGPFCFPAEIPEEERSARPDAREAERSLPPCPAFDDPSVQTVYDNWSWPSGRVYDNLHCLGSSGASAKEKPPAPPPPLPTLPERASDGEEEENVYGEVDLDAAFPPDAAERGGEAAGAGPRWRPSGPPATNRGGGPPPACNGHAGPRPGDSVDDVYNDLASYYREHEKVASSLAAFPVAEQDLEGPPRSLSTSDIGASLAEAASPAADAGGGGGTGGGSFARSWRKKLGLFGASAGGGGSTKVAAPAEGEGGEGGWAARPALGRALCSSAEAISTEGRTGGGGAVSPARRAHSMYDVESPPSTRVCADRNKSRVYTLAREYSMRIKRTRPVTGARDGAGGDVSLLPAVLEMNGQNSGTIGARMAGHMHTYDQIIIREAIVPAVVVDLQPARSSVASSRSARRSTDSGTPPTSPARRGSSPNPASPASPASGLASLSGSRSSASGTPPMSPSRELSDDASAWPTVRGLRMRYQGGAAGGGGGRDADETRVVSSAKSTGNLSTARVRRRGDAGGPPARHGPADAAGHKPRIWSWNGPNADWRAIAGAQAASPPPPQPQQPPPPQFNRCVSAPLGPRRARENYHRNFVDNDDDNEDYVEIRSPGPVGPRAPGAAADTPRPGAGDGRASGKERDAPDGGRQAAAAQGHKPQGSSERSLVQKLKERFQPLSFQSHA